MGMTGQAEAMDDGPELGRREVWAERTFLVLLLVAGFVLRVWGVTKMHSWDENVYLQHGEILCCGKSNYSELDYRPPLLSLLYAGAFLAWNSSYAAAIVTALLNATAALWTYLSGRMMAGRAAAAMAADWTDYHRFYHQRTHADIFLRAVLPGSQRGKNQYRGANMESPLRGGVSNLGRRVARDRRCLSQRGPGRRLRASGGQCPARRQRREFACAQDR